MLFWKSLVGLNVQSHLISSSHVSHSRQSVKKYHGNILMGRLRPITLFHCKNSELSLRCSKWTSPASTCVFWISAACQLPEPRPRFPVVKTTNVSKSNMADRVYISCLQTLISWISFPVHKPTKSVNFVCSI